MLQLFSCNLHYYNYILYKKANIQDMTTVSVMDMASLKLKSKPHVKIMACIKLTLVRQYMMIWFDYVI